MRNEDGRMTAVVELPGGRTKVHGGSTHLGTGSQSGTIDCLVSWRILLDQQRTKELMVAVYVSTDQRKGTRMGDLKPVI